MPSELCHGTPQVLYDSDKVHVDCLFALLYFVTSTLYLMYNVRKRATETIRIHAKNLQLLLISRLYLYIYVCSVVGTCFLSVFGVVISGYQDYLVLSMVKKW